MIVIFVKCGPRAWVQHLGVSPAFFSKSIFKVSEILHVSRVGQLLNKFSEINFGIWEFLFSFKEDFSDGFVRCFGGTLTVGIETNAEDDMFYCTVNYVIFPKDCQKVPKMCP